MNYAINGWTHHEHPIVHRTTGCSSYPGTGVEITDEQMLEMHAASLLGARFGFCQNCTVETGDPSKLRPLPERQPVTTTGARSDYARLLDAARPPEEHHADCQCPAHGQDEQ